MTLESASRRRLLALAAGAALCPMAHAQAQRKLRLVVPFPAGGTADILPRIVADKLQPLYPGGILVDNRSGAGGNIGGDFVFHAKPDGETLMVSPPAPIAINQSLYSKLAFDPSLWVPVTVLATVPNVLVVRPDLAPDVKSLLEYLKANPGKASYASQGNGTTSHLTTCLFMSATGTQLVHVPYKGTAPALIDLMGGHVDLFFDNLSSSLSPHRSGKLHILAVADAKRSKVIPDVPTFAELGLPAVNAVTWFAVMAPPSTPDATVREIQGAMASVLKQPDVEKRFAEFGAEPRGWSPEDTGRFVKAETQKWRDVIRNANVTLEG
jgi:tripartite-type tricarboxylate transporter receptor subunit TctC